MLLYFYARPLFMHTAQLYAMQTAKLPKLDFLLFSRVISSGVIVVYLTSSCVN
jgi:hypothetical protein